MTLIMLAIAWLVGILLADLLPLPLLPLGIVAALGAAVGCAIRGTSWARVAAFAVCCLALGGVRFTIAQVETTPRSVWLLNEKGDITIEGVIAEDPKWTEEGQRVVFASERATAGQRQAVVEGLVLVKLPPYPERHYGDRLRLTGRLRTPREADRPGQFDYRAYLARKQIFSLMEPDASKLISTSNGNPLWSRLLSLRDHARGVLLRELPEPQSSLAVGILLGLQASIPPDVYDTFSTTGTSHILVISVWNISAITLID